MATIKAFTDLQQSKKLAEILPLESADMSYYLWKDDGHLMAPVPYVLDGTEVKENGLFEYVYYWSLAALLGVLPEGYSFVLTKSFNGKDYYCKLDGKPIETMADSSVDACYKMIIKLNELNLL